MCDDLDQEINPIGTPTPIYNDTETEDKVPDIFTPTHTPRMHYSVVEENDLPPVVRVRHPLRPSKTLKDPMYGLPKSMFRSRSFPLSHQERRELGRDWKDD